MKDVIVGRVHSFQSLGTVDGPGVRSVVFLQGCPLRCVCCHNPDTWDFCGGEEYTPEQIVSKIERFKDYFGSEGGITLSGGEPLMQAEFAEEIFSLCKKREINTCLDTSGCILNDSVKTLLKKTDRVLLDIKYTDENAYFKNTGMKFSAVLDFLDYLQDKKIPTTVRQVIIPNINDSEDNILRLNEITKRYSCIDKLELLPFRKICQTKYDEMGIEFSLKETPEPTAQTMKKLNNLKNKDL